MNSIPGGSQENHLLRAALGYAQRGWRVFPLHEIAAGGACSCGGDCGKNRGKHPRTPHGCKDATTDEVTIRAWWGAWPTGNVAIATGLDSGIFVIGPDGPEGVNELARLARRFGALPHTLKARTGGGGEHLYFQWPSDEGIGNRRNHRSLPIDIRGAGGYVLAPPSVNAAGPYRWLREDGPAEAPEWLLMWCRNGMGTGPMAQSTEAMELEQTADATAPKSIDAMVQKSSAATVPSTDGAPQQSDGAVAESTETMVQATAKTVLTVGAGRGADIPARAAAYLAKCPPAVSGQGGHDQTFEVARAVVYGLNLGPEVGYDLLWRHYNPRCVPPWSEKELRHKCQEADQQPFDKPRGYLLANAHPGAAAATAPTKRPLRLVPPYQPFPVQALPGPLPPFVEQAAAALGCDAAYVALPALAAVFGGIGNALRLRLKRSWSEPAVGWFAIIGESGTLKSPAKDLALAHLERVRARLKAENKARKDAYDQQCDDYLDAYRKARKDGREPPPKPARPPERRVLVADVTIERLAEILEDNPRGVLLYREELAGWLGSFTRYRGGAALESSDQPYWLAIHGARPLQVDRKGGERKSVYVPRAAVSLVGGIQPGVLARRLPTTYFDSGLVARILLAYPPRRPKGWTEAEIDPEVSGAYDQLFEKLLALEMGTGEYGPAPINVPLSAEAKDVWVRYYNQGARAQADAEGEVASLLSKMEGYCARFALVHHVVSRLSGSQDVYAPVGPESVAAAVELAEWFANEAQRIYLALGEPEGDRRIRNLIEFIRSRGGKITVRELQRANNRRYPDAAAAEAALRELVGSGLATWVDVPSGPRGGHPTRCCVLCTTHDTTDTTPCLGEEDGGGDGLATGNTTPEPRDRTPSCPTNPQETEGSVSSVMRHAPVRVTDPPSGTSELPQEVVSAPPEAVPADAHGETPGGACGDGERDGGEEVRLV